MFFFSMCGEARQSGSKKGMERRKEGGEGGRRDVRERLLNNSCTSSPPSHLCPLLQAP